MVLAQIQKQQLTLQKKVQSSTEIETLKHRITRILYSPDACLQTVRAATTPLASGSPLTPATGSITLSSIKNANGTDLITVADSTTGQPTYGNGLIKINSIELEPTGISGTDIVQVRLSVTMEKTSRAITGYKLAVRRYPLRVSLDTSNQPLQCFSDFTDALNTAARELCVEMNGGDQTAYNAGPPPTCRPPTANLATCPNSTDLPIGFETASNGTLQFKCATAPNPAPAHPTGFNCFFLAAYRGNHGQANALFQPADADAMTHYNRLDRWKINTDCTPALSPLPALSGPYNSNSPPSYTCTIPATTPSISYNVYRCPTGYSDRFLNPMGSVNDVPDPFGPPLDPVDRGTATGAYAAYMKHYCCI